MEYNDSELDAIEEMAAHGFTPDEISEVVQRSTECAENITAIVLKHDVDTEAFKRYRKGFLKSQLELRQRIFLDAKHGSSPAQALAKKILDDAEFKLNNL
jgi:hypothetical protein